MSRVYIFGEFLLDPRRRTLSRAKLPIPLTSKAFDVLVVLVQNPNRLIGKDELLQAVWGDTIVEEGNLTQYISHLRKALTDDAENPQWIVTMARKGYQFAGEVVSAAAIDLSRQDQLYDSLIEGPAIDAPLNSNLPKMEANANTPKLWRKGTVEARASALWMFATSALLAIGALMVWRYENYRHRITLSPTDTIVLADVENQTSDSVFDDALNNAFRYEMEQTPYLSVLELDKTYSSMEQLGFKQSTKISPMIALLICRQTNSKMVISDSISDVGNRYRLESRALDCRSGATLAEERTEIADRNLVVHELGATAARLRRKLGEPAESLKQFNQPLEIATSSSLEALQAGAKGTRLFLAGNPQAALPLFQRCVELDPNLALSYEGIGAVNEVVGHYDLAIPALARAYQLRDRLTEKDRLNLEFLYLSDVTGELDKAQSVLSKALALFPRDVYFHNNMANVMARLGQPNRAADLENETARLEPSPLYFSWAALVNINANRLNEARSWLDQAKASRYENRELTGQRLRITLIEGDRSTLDQIFADQAHGPDRAFFLRMQSGFEAQQGRFEFAERLRLRSARLTSDFDDISHDLVLSALRNAEVGLVIQAHDAETRALELRLNRDDRMILGLSLARSEKTDTALRIADEVSREAPLDTRLQYYLVPTVRAAVMLQKHAPGSAIDLLRGSLKYELAINESFDSLYPAYIRGLAYLQLRDGQSAAREFHKLIDNPGLCWESVTGPLARLQLARAESLAGDKASARRSYEEFFAIWKDADRDLPVYRQAIAEYAAIQRSR
jgi:eukaryotic-like serine/threonine-protein kinase